MSQAPMDLHGLLEGELYFFLLLMFYKKFALFSFHWHMLYIIILLILTHKFHNLFMKFFKKLNKNYWILYCIIMNWLHLTLDIVACLLGNMTVINGF
jgi:hypothetical protein